MEPPKGYIDRLVHGYGSYSDDIFTAYKNGADAQLEKCCEWLQQWDNLFSARELRAAMRPKPPSLKEKALAVLDVCADSIGAVHENALRRALETLPDEQ